MKLPTLLFIAPLFGGALSQTTPAPLSLRLVTFNIRYAATSLSTGEKPWTASSCTASNPSTCRKFLLLNQLDSILATAPSNGTTLIGLQEVLSSQLSDIKSHLGSSWSHIGIGRDDGKTRGEYSPILYRNDLLTLLFSETKWLSPTPDTPSFGWNAGSRRVVTIGVFESKTTGRRFIHANTHLDNASAQARTEGIKVAMGRIEAVQKQWGPVGVVLTGDFNSAKGQDAHKVVADGGVMEELFDLASAEGKVKGTNRATFTGFQSGTLTFIDFIWVGPKKEKKFTLQRYEIWGNVAQGVYFSDHRAVVGDVTLVG
ncbi:endonuclease/exonuclease/phosphatase family protein [Immersiella caudata]|uniref:Endonuclease/exonuclease/phosphatase family protein n=1 Tax=Immersiella caudata TaxID=314043 RepID=A0AA39TN78_9PEZI|nr:endonuclease/exonuclease/phosphatase family protein [Immersiella caudata]